MSKQGIQALRERKAEIARQANEILAKAGDQVWSSEDQKKYHELTDQIGRLGEQIVAFEASMASDAERMAADALLASGGKPKTEAAKLLASYLRNGANVSPEEAVAIRNAMSTTTPAEGGYTVPTEVVPMVIDALKAFGGMRDVSDVVTSDGGNDWNYPSSDGTGEIGEWVGQNVAATLGEITFGNVLLSTFMASSKKLALPVQLIQDSGIDVVAFVIKRLTQRLGRVSNLAYTVGTGSGQPFGVVPRATSGKVGTTGQTLTVTYADLVDLQHSVNSEYRKMASWMMADLSVRNIRKLVDTNGRPIFVPGYEAGITAGVPDTLLGKAMTVNDDMPVMAANAKSILFGDFKQFQIRDVASSMSVRRFDDSAFALNGQVGFCGWMRTGSNLLDTAAIKFYQNSAT